MLRPARGGFGGGGGGGRPAERPTPDPSRDGGLRYALLVAAPRGAPRLSASAHHFYTSDLDLGNLDEAATVMAHHVTKKREMQKHAAELVERNLVMLHLDRFQMGVGGIHSWGAKPLKEHLFTPDRSYDFSFVLRPYSPALADGKPTAVDEMAALAAEEAARGGMCPLPDL